MWIGQQNDLSSNGFLGSGRRLRDLSASLSSFNSEAKGALH